jgi:glycine/D-amino acid oxidase-like deaminating enzyme
MNTSIWIKDNSLDSHKQLSESIETTICIIGSGISGLYTAYLLAKKGVKVTLIEAESTLGGVATKRSTGKLSAQHGLIYSKIPPHERELYYSLNASSIERIKEIISPEQFEHVTSYIYTNTDEGVEKLQKEIEAYKDLPFTATITKEIEVPVPLLLALGMPNMEQINPVTFTAELAKLARDEGVEIYTSTRAVSINVGSKSITTNRGFTISCEHIIICSHYPVESLRNSRTAFLHVDRSYLSASEVQDTLTSHYLCIDKKAERTIRTASINNKQYLIYGGGNHIAGTVGNPESYYDQLKSDLENLFDIHEPFTYWSSQDIKTEDHYPYIGQLMKNDSFLYVATGFNKWGLSTSLVAGEIISSLICKEHHNGIELFSPLRSQFGKQLFYLFSQSGFVIEQLIKGYAKRLNAPKCTHLGCKTNWNEVDETWDCPCHGSRFYADGKVMEGPAVYPLDLKQ